MLRTQKLRIGVCIVVSFFGVLAAVFAIAAEVKHVRAHQLVIVGDDCFYPSNPAWALGLLGASCLLVAQIIANACGGCVCCCTNRNVPMSGTTRTVAILCLVLSWITFANAFFLLLEGAALNGQQQYGQAMIHSCYIIKPGVFAAGAGLAIFTVILGIIYYVMATSGTDSAIAVGQPATSALRPSIFSRYEFCSFDTSRRHIPPIPYVAGVELPKRFEVY